MTIQLHQLINSILRFISSCLYWDACPPQPCITFMHVSHSEWLIFCRPAHAHAEVRRMYLTTCYVTAWDVDFDRIPKVEVSCMRRTNKFRACAFLLPPSLSNSKDRSRSRELNRNLENRRKLGGSNSRP